MIRYYLGRHKVEIIKICGKKVIVKHLENGYVGNSDAGYKQVKEGDYDIISAIRNLRRNKK